MPIQNIIETDRLFIRLLLSEDDEGMFQLDSDPVVHKYLGNKPVKTIEESRDVIVIIRQQYEEFGIGRWAMLDKVSDEFIGWVGFKLVKGPINKHSNFIDFGYRTRQQFWNKGYATEASKACLQYGLTTLKYKDIYAMTDINNAASRRVLEKTGFQLIEIFEYDAEPNWRAPNELTTWYKYEQPNVF